MPKQTGAADHVAPAFDNGRNSELHGAGYGAPVPWRDRPCAVLFPTADPRKIAALPGVPKRQLRSRMPRDEIPLLPLRIDQVRRKSSGWRLGGITPQVLDAMILARTQGPFKLRSPFQRAAEILVDHTRTGGRHAELGLAVFHKRRTECHMLGPANGPVGGSEILHRFVEANHVAGY